MGEEYQLLFDSIKDYAIYMTDVSGNITTWNTGAERLKGYKTDEIIGQNFSILFLPEDREKGKPAKELQVAKNKGKYEDEGWRLKKDGTKFWAHATLRPVYSDTKEHIGFAKVTRDLTEKRRSEELYLLLVSQVNEYAIFMMNADGNILTWNNGAERIKGYNAQEIIGKNFSIFYTQEDKDAGKPKQELEIAIRTGKYEEEGWRLKKDGSRFWANVVITPIYSDRHIGFAKVTRDLSKRKEMEHLTRANLVLEATNKELERFAYTASHDLKEPIRKIESYSTMILRDESNHISPRQETFLKKIVASSQRMKAMIEDILDFSTLSEKPHFEKCSLNELVRQTLDLIENIIEDKNAKINYTNLPYAIVIPQQIRQLFQNLISNSLKFSTKEVTPEINIMHEYLNKEAITSSNLWPSESYLKITVKDNGIGFDPEYAERIFNLFDRLHGRAEYEGTGVGLAISKKIVENHGGIITAKSQVGEGAEFSIIIPG